jgi:Mg-chelatase subunit ChlD
MKTNLLGIALVAATVSAVALYPTVRGAGTIDNPDPVAHQAASKIEVVFVLDTTSSMSGLIDAAKEKIWSIATTMAQAAEHPEIHMGLVAFRDRGDAYVTQVVDLSPDLDSMYAQLMQFAAVGGGDGPESVNAALSDAVDRISWSQNSDTYQVIFLVGDAPPHMDYRGESHYPQIVQSAAARGIVVNTIQCGEVQQTFAHWNEIARLGKGRYMQVGQSGDAFAVTTPYDDEIAKLSAELDGTRMFYGDDEARVKFSLKEAATETLHSLASVAAQARRAVFNTSAAGIGNLFGDSDLIENLEAGRVNLEDVPSEQLPEPLRALAPAALEAEIDAVVGQRGALRQRIHELSDARSSFIEERVDATEGVASSLDQLIYDTVREQAGAKGLTYESGPEF